MTYKRKPLWKHKTPQGEFSFASEYEEILASKWHGTPWPMWLTMDGHEQAKIVAAHRTHNKIEAVVEAESKRKSWLQRLLNPKGK